MSIQEKFALKMALYIFIWGSPMLLLPFEGPNTFRIGLMMWSFGALGGMLLLPVLWKLRWEGSLPGILKSMYKDK